jgi:predicted flap endonuclease-1-like 5' DNA nuclease
MALLQKIKAKLGIGSGPAEREETDPEVTVERESERSDAGDNGEADEAAGSAVVEEDSAAETDEPASGAEPADDEPAADATVDDDAVDDQPAAEAEPAADEAGEATDDEPAAAASDSNAGAAESGVGVEEIKGIGPAYAERLADIGIDTVADLAAADAEAVAEETSVGEKRAATWIGRAAEF